MSSTVRRRPAITVLLRRDQETWDFSAVRGLKWMFRLTRSRNDTRAGMEKTLANIAELLAAS